MTRLMTPEALEILRFAAEGKAWPTGEPAAIFRETIDKGEAPAKQLESAPRAPMDAAIIRQALLGNDVNPKTGVIFLNTEAHHGGDWDELDSGLYRNSTIFIKSIEVKGVLNMLAADVRRPVYFFDCDFPDGVSFQNSTWKLLGFYDCRLAYANLHGLEVRKSFLLQKSHCLHGVDLSNAKIGGALTCAGSRLEARTEDIALDLNGADVGQSVFLSEYEDTPFHATGMVDLVGVTIGSSLECAGAKFEVGADRTATLNCNGATIAKSVFLRNGTSNAFHANGPVDFVGAHIGGNLECSGGRFEAGNAEYALSCDGATIGESAFLRADSREPFFASGLVDFRGAYVGGQMDCSGGRFERGTGGEGEYLEALTLRQAIISGDFIWWDIRSFFGCLNLNNATVGTFVDNSASWPNRKRTRKGSEPPFEGEFILDGFRYDRLDGGSPTEARSRLKWLACQPKNHSRKDFRPFAWTQIARILRADGHEDDAREVAIDREAKRTRMYRERWMQGEVDYIPHWIGGFIFGALVRYGYRPRRGVLISALLVLLFGFLFAYEEGQNRFVPAQDESLIYMADRELQIPPHGYPAFNPWVYSIDLFIPLIDLQQASNWQPLSTRPSSGPRPGMTALIAEPDSTLQYLALPSWGRALMWLEIAIGWVLTALTGLAFTGVLRRE